MKLFKLVTFKYYKSKCFSIINVEKLNVMILQYWHLLIETLVVTDRSTQTFSDKNHNLTSQNNEYPNHTYRVEV